MVNEKLNQLFQPIRDYADIVEIDQAKQAIEAYIAEREKETRIDELNVLEKALDDPKYSYPGEDGWDYDMYKYLEDRENQLKSNERVSNE